MWEGDEVPADSISALAGLSSLEVLALTCTDPRRHFLINQVMDLRSCYWFVDHAALREALGPALRKLNSLEL